MIRPMKAQNTVEFTLAFNRGADVTWSMKGKSAFGIPAQRACLESVFWREIHAVEFGNRIELPFPSRTVEWLIYHSTVPRFESESSVDITADAVPEPNRFSPVT
jgi:hypothetical protein